MTWYSKFILETFYINFMQDINPTSLNFIKKPTKQCYEKSVRRKYNSIKSTSFNQQIQFWSNNENRIKKQNDIRKLTKIYDINVLQFLSLLAKNISIWIHINPYFFWKKKINADSFFNVIRNVSIKIIYFRFECMNEIILKNW